MIKIDVHQHLWTQPLVQALADRRELPFVRQEGDLTVLYLAGEQPYVIDTPGETPARRVALLRLDDLDRGLVCLSSPLGIESLPREQSLLLIDAYLEGALSLGDPFGVLGRDRARSCRSDRCRPGARLRLRRTFAASGGAGECDCCLPAIPSASAT